MRRFRLANDWTQAELAALTEGLCTERTIGNYERGDTTPRWPGSHQVKALAEIFRVSPRHLIYGEEE